MKKVICAGPYRRTSSQGPFRDYAYNPIELNRFVVSILPLVFQSPSPPGRRSFGDLSGSSGPLSGTGSESLGFSVDWSALNFGVTATITSTEAISHRARGRCSGAVPGALLGQAEHPDRRS